MAKIIHDGPTRIICDEPPSRQEQFETLWHIKNAEDFIFPAEMQNRFEGFMDVVAQHVGEPLLVAHLDTEVPHGMIQVPIQSITPKYQLGIARKPSEKRADGKPSNAGTVISDASAGINLRYGYHAAEICIGYDELRDAFKTCCSDWRLVRVPELQSKPIAEQEAILRASCYQLIVGRDEIAKWMASYANPGLKPGQLQQMCKALGIEPIPVIETSDERPAGNTLGNLATQESLNVNVEGE
jgi:hypothetical protein